VLSPELGLACTTDINPCNLYFWSTLKNEVYVTNHQLQEFNTNTQEEILLIPRQ